MQRSILLFELASISGDNKKENRTMIVMIVDNRGEHCGELMKLGGNLNNIVYDVVKSLLVAIKPESAT